MTITVEEVLPKDSEGIFVGRVQDPQMGYPVPVLYRDGRVWDLSGLAPTCADLLEREDLHARLDEISGQSPRWRTDELVLEGEAAGGSPELLAPIDLQVIKACGVTFADSMIERVIEERSHGEPAVAAQIRETMRAEVGEDLGSLVPGSEESRAVKAVLSERGWWSQYLEVGLGPYPEVFTKGPVLSSVGTGAAIGIPEFSLWNNPEPELVLIVDSQGTIRGVTLGNDVNLRDVEGRSALLLGMAKDNNRSTAIGPLIRLFDETFTIDDARVLEITLSVEGEDGFRLDGLNSVAALSRSFENLVQAAQGPHHQYPDGFALFTGTLFAPTEDREAPGEGFTHHLNDTVVISNERLGSLTNVVGRTEELPPWNYGLRSLFRDLPAPQPGGAGSAQN